MCELRLLSRLLDLPEHGSDLPGEIFAPPPHADKPLDYRSPRGGPGICDGRPRLAHAVDAATCLISLRGAFPGLSSLLQSGRPGVVALHGISPRAFTIACALAFATAWATGLARQCAGSAHSDIPRPLCPPPPPSSSPLSAGKASASVATLVPLAKGAEQSAVGRSAKPTASQASKHD
jgi:hypothetical protein